MIMPSVELHGILLWKTDIGSGIGLVPPNNKPLPEPRALSTYGVARPQLSLVV